MQTALTAHCRWFCFNGISPSFAASKLVEVARGLGTQRCERMWEALVFGVRWSNKNPSKEDSKDWKWKEAKIQAPCRVKLIYAAMWRVLRPVPPTSWNAMRIFLIASDTPYSVNNPGSKNWMKLAILEHKVIKVIFHGHPGTDFPLPWLLKRGRERGREWLFIWTPEARRAFELGWGGSPGFGNGSCAGGIACVATATENWKHIINIHTL